MNMDKKRKASVEANRAAIKKAKVTKPSLQSKNQKEMDVEGKRKSSKAAEKDIILLNENSSELDVDEDFGGFSSNSDTDDEGNSSSDEKPVELKDIPGLPKIKTLDEKLKKGKENVSGKRGTVYVGRIPHGFYEHQMRAYFSQFGDITRLRLSRNRHTGQSKHFAFVEFASVEVARIVAETMDNYLMFGHILKCKFVPDENIHPKLWVGANRRFKKIPWNKLEERALKSAKSRDQWQKKIKAETKRRDQKLKKYKALGYEFNAPSLKSVDVVPVREKAKLDSEATPGQISDADKQTKTLEPTVHKDVEKPQQNLKEVEVAKDDSAPIAKEDNNKSGLSKKRKHDVTTQEVKDGKSKKVKEAQKHRRTSTKKSKS